MDNNMTGAELQCLRESCGLDRDQLGVLCGVQGRSIKYWETGASNHGVPADVAALVLDMESKISQDAANEIDIWLSVRPDPVLMRGSDPLKNAVANRVYVELRRRGIPVRMVAFDYPAYCAWLERGGIQGRQDHREDWARQAVKDQSKPHRADQPG